MELDNNIIDKAKTERKTSLSFIILKLKKEIGMSKIILKNEIIGGKSLEKWDLEWKEKGELNKDNIEDLKGNIGLYRISYGIEKLYIGVGKEIGNSKGLYKRLNDYIRNNSSGRNSEVAKEIHEKCKSKSEEVTFEVLVVGNDESAVFASAYLELYFINKYKPVGNTIGSSRCKGKKNLSTTQYYYISTS
ncbi:hypothetical protein [Andreesenia angusta]|uniref:hypothetical protein n=1 Tax=Andreesenia angusta TaxID=39480 RepID=UPI001B80D3AB|nr:hypothetical protein [Andreesenia angusta]